MDKLVIVDENDKPLGLEEKWKCHAGKGILHRAFSVFVFNQKGELLVHQRSKEKPLWPLYWSNTCCSHPLEDESYEEAGHRRLVAEMGFSCVLRLVGTFRYQASYQDKGSENEFCAVLVGQYDGEIHPNPQEVADWKWIASQDLREDIAADSDKYTPWFKTEIERFFPSFSVF
jgi:isopentenyl-diphosphate delta-isomerase